MAVQEFLLVLIVTLVAMTIAETSSEEDSEDDVVKAHKASLTNYPFQVALQYHTPPDIVDKFCGGAIIAPEWILTGAHCFDTDHANLFINAGVIDASDKTDQSQNIEVQQKFIHPGYNGSELDPQNDIALLKLKEKLTFNKFVQAIELPAKDSEPTGKGTILGWGSTGDDTNPLSEYLIHVPTTILPGTECEEHLTPGKTQVCVGPQGSTGTCQGDSGGPFIQVIDDTQVIVGIVSSGTEFCADNPDVFTKVSAYIDFIEVTMKSN